MAAPTLSPPPSQWTANPLIVAVIAGFAVSMSAFFLRSTTSGNVHDLGGIPVLTAWDFFKKRFDFLQRHFRKSGGKMFRLRVLHVSSKTVLYFAAANLSPFQHRVIAMASEEARKVFFNDQSLDFTEGYKILMGGAPRLKEINIQTDGSDQLRPFINRLLLLLRKDRVADSLSPFLLSYSQSKDG